MFDYLPIDPRDQGQPTLCERLIATAGMIAGSIVFAAVVYGIILFVGLVL
jgi:hypothetical protein